VAIDFEIQRVGRVFSCTADGGAPFFVGIQTMYQDKTSGQSFEGLFNVPTRQLPPLLYKADNYRASAGFWADFIEPTALCEGQNFLTLNTYDRARFTWGFGQFGAHVPDGDFVRFFRQLLGQPQSADYFPDLSVSQAGRIVRIQNGRQIDLESSTSTAPLLDYLNPSSSQVDDAEVIAGAKLIHWTTNHDNGRGLQVDQMVETFKRLMTDADRNVGLDGKTADLCCVVCDILHQGRGNYATIRKALRSGKPLAQLLAIGATSYRDRIKTLSDALEARSGVFIAKSWSRAAAAFQ
jgi:hypothetical protein